MWNYLGLFSFLKRYVVEIEEKTRFECNIIITLLLLLLIINNIISLLNNVKEK